jgi:hypothetical protein
MWLRSCGFCTIALANFVSINPGAIAFTRIPDDPISNASVCVIEITAAFVIPYTPCIGAARCPMMLAMLTIAAPPPRCRACAIIVRAQKK